MPNGFQATSIFVAPPAQAPAPASPSSVEEIASFVGVSAVLRRLLLQAEITAPRLHVAAIDGEAGTGKHLFARTLHGLSPMAHQPLRRRDAREWLASETELSALTGTLYLDRVDLLAAPGQALLLSLVKMLQSAQSESSDHVPRFVLLGSALTSLRQLAAQGEFLPDLAFRMTAVRFSIPPLREHREDIAPITQTLIERICRRYHQSTAVLGVGAMPRLLQHSWPGNVRELATVLESAILDSSHGMIRSSSLQLDIPAAVRVEQMTSGAQTSNYDDLSLDAMIRRHIVYVLELNRGNKLRAARQLGISRSTLYRLLGGDAGAIV